jgi:hypothetical protein
MKLLRRWRLPLVLLVLPLLLAARLQTPEPNRAAVVVRSGEGQVDSRCVAFAEETISGYELLARSGIDLVVDASGAGVMVCSIAGEGCPASNCLCECQGEPCTYWSYWRWRDDEWQYAGLGASVTQIAHGDVDGWSWGPGSVTSAIAPPAASFDEVCAAGATVAQGTAAGATDAGDEGAIVWLPYALFLLFIALLGGAYVLLPRRKAS